MRHLFFRGLFLKRIVTIASVLAFACVPAAVAQRSGAHVGGGAGHFPGRVGGPQMTMPRAPAPRPAPMPPPPRPVAPPRPITVTPQPRPLMPVVPRAIPIPVEPWRPASGFRTPGVRGQMIPPKRVPIPRPTLIQPVAPILSYPVFFGQPPAFFGLGAGLGWNALWWQGCGPFSLWYLGCNATPFYGYGFENYLPSASEFYEPPPLPAYQPAYIYEGEPRELAQLYLKDGTVYDVTDYWVVDNELHFTTTENGKSVEHVIPFDSLDLQKSIDVNTQRGFHFVLRNEPMAQYLRDHPELGSPTSPVTPSDGAAQASPSTAAPAEPPQTQTPTGTLVPTSPQTSPGAPQTQSPPPQAPQP